ncbi:hypothetical protein FA95DRAFT_1684844 [Auriscalpium vulgare]|uniref:Uncharacterized protein n=1 Tax=Auriscalpium vulgare TaxID=40419 RepID=A0ACB8R0J0_9AGAM|nr:hypothetical protein FA95DRAFT_1684844 [Auriscalpium vulgare]
MRAPPRRRSGRAISPGKIAWTPAMLRHPLAVKTTSPNAQQPSTPRLQRRQAAEHQRIAKGRPATQGPSASLDGALIYERAACAIHGPTRRPRTRVAVRLYGPGIDSSRHVDSTIGRPRLEQSCSRPTDTRAARTAALKTYLCAGCDVDDAVPSTGTVDPSCKQHPLLADGALGRAQLEPLWSRHVSRTVALDEAVNASGQGILGAASGRAWTTRTDDTDDRAKTSSDESAYSATVVHLGASPTGPSCLAAAQAERHVWTSLPAAMASAAVDDAASSRSAWVTLWTRHYGRPNHLDGATPPLDVKTASGASTQHLRPPRPRHQPVDTVCELPRSPWTTRARASLAFSTSGRVSPPPRLVAAVDDALKSEQVVDVARKMSRPSRGADAPPAASPGGAPTRPTRTEAATQRQTQVGERTRAGGHDAVLADDVKREQLEAVERLAWQERERRDFGRERERRRVEIVRHGRARSEARCVPHACDARVTDAIAKPASDADDGMWFPGRAPEDAGPPVNYEHVFDGYVWEKTLIPPDRWAGPFLLGTPEALNFFIQLKAYLHELRTLPPFV